MQGVCHVTEMTVLQALKLQELFHGRFSFEEARELIAAKGDLQEAANFVLNGNLNNNLSMCE